MSNKALSVHASLACALVLTMAPHISAADKPAATPAVTTPEESKKSFRFETGLALGLEIASGGLSVGPGIGIDVGGALRLGGGAFTFHLRTQYQRFGKSDNLALPCATPVSSPCISSGSLSYEMSQTELDFGLRLAYRIFADKSFTPYLGFAPKLALLKASTKSLGQENTEVDSRFGFSGFLGALYNVGPGHVFGELEYQITSVRHTITGDAALGAFGIFVGYRLSL